MAPQCPDTRQQLHKKGAEEKEGGEKKQEKGKAMRKRNQRKVQRRQKDESMKEKGGGEGLKGSQTLCTPSTADAIFCLAE